MNELAANSRQMLVSYVERIERLNEEIDGLNEDKSEIFKEAKSNGFDVPALKRVVGYRRKEHAAEGEAMFSLYLGVVGEVDSGLDKPAKDEATRAASVDAMAQAQ